MVGGASLKSNLIESCPHVGELGFRCLPGGQIAYFTGIFGHNEDLLQTTTMTRYKLLLLLLQNDFMANMLDSEIRAL